MGGGGSPDPDNGDLTPVYVGGGVVVVVVSWVSLQVSCALDSMPASVVALQLHFSPSRGLPPARLVWASGSDSPCLTSTAEDSSSRRRRRAACGISPEDEKQQFAHHEAASHRATKLPSTPCGFLSPHHLDYTSKKTPWGEGGGGQKQPARRAACCGGGGGRRGRRREEAIETATPNRD